MLKHAVWTLLLGFPLTLQAQTHAKLAEELLQGAEEGRRQVVEESMNLSAEEAEAFWPVYDEFRKEMTEVQRHLFRLAGEYADAYPDITDEMAEHFMDEFETLKKDELAGKVKYFPRFREVLAPRRAARFIQLDTKLDALVNIDAAQSIPLVE